jgi:hypothetical protein
MPASVLSYLPHEGDDNDFVVDGAPLPPPPPPATVDLSRVIASSAFRREDSVQALAQTISHVDRALALESARLQVAQAERTNSRALTSALRELAASPLIGKDTQAAFFRTIMLDYMENQVLVAQGAPASPTAPSLRDVLAAAKLLNETAGLNAPTKVESTLDITLKAFPVAQAPFQGELPELVIQDAQVTPL